MRIDVVPNRNSRPAYLLRESYREGNKVRKRTIANLSSLSEEQIAAFRVILSGQTMAPIDTLFKVDKSRAHGHIDAVRVAMSRLRLSALVSTRPSRERDLVCAIIAARIIAARHLQEDSLVLYDLSSSYFEGKTCPLARLGCSRDGKKGKSQVNYGLLTDARGCPVSVSV